LNKKLEILDKEKEHEKNIEKNKRKAEIMKKGRLD